MSLPLPPDRLNEIGVLTRREIEARILIPVLDALCEELDRERVLEIAARAIRVVARAQGRQLAEAMGGDSLAHLAASLDDWRSNGALEIEVREQSDERFAFDVTRCRYAEMYRALGRPDLGDTFSCGRDFALCEGFNPRMRLTRTQTIMEGASHCDFRFEIQSRRDEPASPDRGGIMEPGGTD
jgi:hypothetical protein